MTTEKVITFKGTEEQIIEVFQPLSLLSSKEHSDFFRIALRSNLNNLQVDESKYLDRLRQQYKNYKSVESKKYMEDEDIRTLKGFYDSVRLFCLDCELVSFNDIETMEYEVNSSF
jgi:hypothetical protein